MGVDILEARLGSVGRGLSVRVAEFPYNSGISLQPRPSGLSGAWYTMSSSILNKGNNQRLFLPPPLPLWKVSDWLMSNRRGAKVLLLARKKKYNLASFVNIQNKSVPRITSSYAVPGSLKKLITREQRVPLELTGNAKHSCGSAILVF